MTKCTNILITNLLAEQQYGFRKKKKKHSREYAAIKLINHVTVSKEIESCKTPGNMYTDLSKAFDTLTFDIFIIQAEILWGDWYRIKFNE